MSANLARNVAHHDIPLAVHNRTTARTERFYGRDWRRAPDHGELPEFMAALHLQ
jgi:6-phosphogluconate dehydrogenase